MSALFAICEKFIENILNPLGYFGIIILMAIESACIPLPSEIIMPYGGYLVATFSAKYSNFGMAIAGALGCVLGSLLAYYIGLFGGRPIVEKYGKYILIKKEDLIKGDEFFAKYGDWAIFFGRLLPIVRTFISFPAGVSKVNIVKFIIYTFLGSFPWCFVLSYLGNWATKNVKNMKAWEYVKNSSISHYAHYIIVFIIIIFIVIYVWHHIKSNRENQ